MSNTISAPFPKESASDISGRLSKSRLVQRSDPIRVTVRDECNRHPLWRAHLILA